MANATSTKTVQYPEGTMHLPAVGLHFFNYTDSKGRFISQMFQGKSAKSVGYAFRTEDSRFKWIAQQVESAEYRIEANARYKAEAAEKKAEMLATLKVGQILHYSWGYDQTNAEFYQVIERKAKTVVIRQIGRQVRDTSDMTSMVKPARDQFLAKAPMTKLITSHGVKMDYGIASPCGDDEEFYDSSYA